MGILDFLSQGREANTPPPSVDPSQVAPRDSRSAPLTYAYVLRREPHVGISFDMAPDSQTQAFYDLPIGWQEAPDPIRQSDFWMAGNKVHPQARMPITSHLAIGSLEAVMQDEFQIGKLLGYLRKNMYAGAQAPSVVRTNISEAVPTTFGSQYTISGMPQAGSVVLASGLSYTPESLDGYPY